MVLTIEQFANRCVTRVKDQKDIVVAVTGTEGDGKSSIAIRIAMAADPAFDLERNILYSPSYDEMKNKIVGLPPYSAIVADEAVKSMYKLNWASKVQRFLNVLFTLCRQESKIILLCMPRFSDFSEYYRNHRIRFWINVVDPISKNKQEGYASVCARSFNPYSSDPWYFKETERAIMDYAKLKKLKEPEFNLGHKITSLSRARNYIGIMKFGHIPDELFVRYSELKRKYAYNELDNIDVTKNTKDKINVIRMQKLINYLHESSDMSYNQIANIVGVSGATIKKIVLEKAD